MTPVGPTAKRQPCPQSDSVGGVRRNSGNSGEQQRGEQDEASAARDGIESAAEHRSEKQKNRIRQVEVRKAQAVRNVSETKNARVGRTFLSHAFALWHPEKALKSNPSDKNVRPTRALLVRSLAAVGPGSGFSFRLIRELIAHPVSELMYSARDRPASLAAAGWCQQQPDAEPHANAD